jgi:hypothetical protein
MKTPRDILFARHHVAAPKLDAIRRQAVAELNHQDTKAQSQTINLVSWCLGGFQKMWLELILPSRRIWAGLAAVWILLFVFNFSQRDPAELMARKSAPASPEMILTFPQQERLMAELIGPNEIQAVTPPKSFLPQPRSEGRIEILMT